MKRDFTLVLILLVALTAVVLLSRSLDARGAGASAKYGEDQLYLSGPTAKRLTLAFNGLAADWYWMRSLQYVGGKVVAYQDTHEGQFALDNLSTLDLKLLPSLLQVTTTLDPQFSAAYEYGAVLLPEINPDEAVSLLNKGIAANPSSWKLYQHLGYIHWQRQDYEKASEAYAAGSKQPGAPDWMTAMAARMKADRGSRESAREMYRHLAESSNDNAINEMVAHQIMRLQWLDDRDEITHVLRYLENHSPYERCPESWRGVFAEFPGTRLRFDSASGAPLDPSGIPYLLVKGRCEVELDPNSRVPR
jgi:tetratricopeptide (TPR) repeat protein